MSGRVVIPIRAVQIAIMGSMPPKKNEATALPSQPSISPPDSPAEAFEQFVEIIRKSGVALVGVQPDDLFRLLRPFIVNPRRNEAAVRAIALAFGATTFTPAFAQFLKLSRWIPGMKKLRDTIDQTTPNLVERLRELEAMLKTDLRPGNVVVHLKPIQYLETPQGYGLADLHRYRLIVQTLVEPSAGDALDAVSIQLTASSESAEVVVDAITPQPGFSVVGLKESGGIQQGMQEVISDKQTRKGEVSGPGAKISSTAESTYSVQESTLISVGTERSVVRVEQYLMARKVGNRAIWRVLAGIGPIDAGGIEYMADLLVPDRAQEILIKIEAKVDWMYGGTVPTAVEKSLALPRPQLLSSGV